MRFYLTNESYPEIREIPRGWGRHLTWWRAFRSAATDLAFWMMILSGLGLAALFTISQGPVIVLLGLEFREIHVALAAVAALAMLAAGGVFLSWGGYIMRGHLRRTSLVCRDACPLCGHLLTSQLHARHERVECTECGGVFLTRDFEMPGRVPIDQREHDRELTTEAGPVRNQAASPSA
jgi:hypothetical protein